jgi:hypothetical protein
MAVTLTHGVSEEHGSYHAHRSTITCRWAGGTLRDTPQATSALEAVRDLGAAAAMADQVVAIADGFEHFELFVDGESGKRIACAVIERDEL